MKKTAAYLLIEQRLDVPDLAAHIAAQRAAGTSWDDLSRQIRDSTDVTVSRETLRNWHQEAEAAAAEALTA